MSWSWHRIATAIISLYALITSGISIYFYNKIRLNPDECSEITSTEALTGLWLNIILAIFSGLLFIWTLLESAGKNSNGTDSIIHTKTNTIYHEPEVTDYSHTGRYAYTPNSSPKVSQDFSDI